MSILCFRVEYVVLFYFTGFVKFFFMHNFLVGNQVRICIIIEFLFYYCIYNRYIHKKG
uniref:Uncharacterized protein n=1 Tax=Physcomitrium patens TaxID=3218 RepID=A0A2K1INF4_PHYPA|nr:hypothetical protein PHYPA_027131 [Physcomitrium patens]